MISSTPAGYQSQSIDTTIAADRLRFRLYRQRSPLERLQLAARFRQQARQLSLACLQQNFAQLAPPVLARKVAQAWLSDKCPPYWFPQLDAMNWSQDPLAIAALISRILDEAQVPYYVTGGVAAIAHGEPRATLDLDIVISIPLLSLAQLVGTLEAEGFYVAGLADALSGKRPCLNATHLETIENIDLMLADDSEYEQLKFERRQWYQIADGKSIAIATPEDIVISKLQWRRRSQSDKQWRDILGILKVQQERLDVAYIEIWAERFQLQQDWQQAKLAGGLEELE